MSKMTKFRHIRTCRLQHRPDFILLSKFPFLPSTYRMSVVGKVESLWRYPVKSMHGEEMEELFAGYGGVYGDGLFAFRSSAAPPGFPSLAAANQGPCFRLRPLSGHPDKPPGPSSSRTPTRSESAPPRL